MGRRALILGYARRPALVPWPDPPPPVPSGVIELTAVGASTSTVQLSFQGIQHATSYEYRVDGGTALALPQNKLVGGLAAATLYSFQVRPINVSGAGPWSNAATATTIAVVVTPPPVPPPTPTPTPPPPTPPATPPPPPFTVGAGPYSVFGDHLSAGGPATITTNALNITPTGGTPPYAFEFEMIGEPVLQIINGVRTFPDNEMTPFPDANTGTTTFSATVDPNWRVDASFNCTITDAVGASVVRKVRVAFAHYENF